MSNSLIDHLRAAQNVDLEARASHTVALADLRAAEVRGEEIDDTTVRTHVDAKAKLDEAMTARAARIQTLEAEHRADEAAVAFRAAPAPQTRAYDEVARVGREERTYHPGNDRDGTGFLRDVGQAFLGSYGAQDRLRTHMQEERVERSHYLQRASATGNFDGLVVPQYLTDMYAPFARANRPFADSCNAHPLPADGMVVNISRITTGSSAALQATQNTAVSETNVDDTLLTVNVQTTGGQQTLSRQAVERGTGIEGVVMEDLMRAYATNLDSTLLNQAVTGLSAAATTVAAGATADVTAIYPKFAEAASGVEAALLDQSAGDLIAVMHSRRWYWLQNALASTWPIMGQPGIAPQMAFQNYAETYGSGVRGVLPNGIPVIVDNNVTTTAGAGTNEDEIYILSRREAHLWEDVSAPVMIRAEQPPAASLGILYVVYGYFAYTHARYAQARKISGTALVTPVFDGS